MLKKCFVGFVLVACAAGVWNWTRVVAASEKVRDAWIESQQEQTLEDWDVHYRKGMRKLRHRSEKLARKARGQRLAAETARIQLERVGQQLARSKKVTAAFATAMARADQGFVFAGQRYDGPLGKQQATRFAAEVRALANRKKALEAKIAVHARTAEKYEQAVRAIELQGRKLQARAQQLEVRRQVIETQRILAEIEAQREQLAKEGCKPLESLETLCRTAEEALDREEARQRIRERKAPARTLSLEEAGRRQVPEGEDTY